MDLSMTMPTMLPHGRAEVLAWCRGIDEGPWASLAVPERITFPSQSLIVELSAAAALTERVRLWTTLTVLPLHQPVAVAKQMASVDQLSGGRLTLGIGVGGREHDYLALDASYARRWARMDDQVAVMQRTWAGEPPFPGGDAVGPAPVQEGGPPLVAGSLGPRSMARAARWAAGVTGWTFDGDAEAVAAGFALATAAWRDAGRTDSPHQSTSIWFALGDGAEERLRSYAYRYLAVFGEASGRWAAETVTCHTPAELRRVVDAVAAAGADELFLVPTTADPDELDRAREALGR